MTIYDAAMVGVLIAGMVWGAMRGITWQVAGLASLVLGYAVAFPLSGELASQFPGEPVVARGLAMLAVYVGVSGGVYLVAWLIRATLRKMKFEAYDRHLGMILGGAEGAILGIVVTVFVVSLAPSTRAPILTSTSGRVVNGFLAAVQPALPGEVRTVLAPFWGDSSAGATGSRLADVDAYDKPRLDEVPSEARAAMDWFQKILPGPVALDSPESVATTADAPTPDRALDPSVIQSWMKLGARQLTGRAREQAAEASGSVPPPLDSRTDRYWWENDDHGRDTRHR